MKYFYARVSTKNQNLARQYAAAENCKGIDRIFADKQSGKSFDREQYNEMKSILEAGDEVIVKSLDRLGRNKTEMKVELEWFRSKGVLLRVMDLPTTMMEFPKGNEWIFEMVNNILIEVLGTIAEQERLTIQKRREEGISAMPIVDGRRVSEKTGRGFGRPKTVVDSDVLKALSEDHARGIITVKECCERLNIGRSTWYALVAAS